MKALSTKIFYNAKTNMVELEFECPKCHGHIITFNQHNPEKNIFCRCVTRRQENITVEGLLIIEEKS